MYKKIIIGIISLFLIFCAVDFSLAQEDLKSAPTLVLFYSPSCHKCIQVKSELMPQIEKEFKGKILIEYRDTSDFENYKLMLGAKERYAKDLKIVLPVAYIGTHFLNLGIDTQALLKKYIHDSLLACPLPPEGQEELPKQDLRLQFLSFRPLAIISAGLVDGINPCALTVIVFFISFLSLQGYKRRQLIIIGLSFISAVFLTYLILGLGIFSFLYRLKGFLLLVKAFNLCIGILSLALGLFCLYDFLKFKKTGETEGLLLQLPRA